MGLQRILDSAECVMSVPSLVLLPVSSEEALEVREAVWGDQRVLLHLPAV